MGSAPGSHAAWEARIRRSTVSLKALGKALGGVGLPLGKARVSERWTNDWTCFPSVMLSGYLSTDASGLPYEDFPQEVVLLNCWPRITVVNVSIIRILCNNR